MRLVVETLNSGTRIVRPEHGLGTCGWYPKAWQAVVLRRRESPIEAFLAANRNWSWSELEV